MNKNKFLFKKRNYFLEDYFKNSLPSFYYKNLFRYKIKNSEYIKDYKFSKQLETRINKFWDKYENINLIWHRAYIATSGIEAVEYIPENIFYKKIEPTLNRYELYRAYSDKNVYDKTFKKYKMPLTIIRNMNGNFYTKEYKKIYLEEAIELVINHAQLNKIVIKPSIDTGGGRNVKIIDLRNRLTDEIRKEILYYFKSFSSDFIIQQYLEQNSVFNKMHADSLNTIRIISLRIEDEIKILSSIVRMGNNGSKVDNATIGGLTCGFDKDGKLNDFATDHLKYQKYKVHPYSGFEFKNVYIPNSEKCFELVKNAHENLKYFDIVSWDLAIDQIGEPNLIEINIKAQDINFHQRNNGPLFGNLTEFVLQTVYKKNK